MNARMDVWMDGRPKLRQLEMLRNTRCRTSPFAASSRFFSTCCKPPHRPLPLPLTVYSHLLAVVDRIWKRLAWPTPRWIFLYIFLGCFIPSSFSSFSFFCSLSYPPFSSIFRSTAVTNVDIGLSSNFFSYLGFL